MPPNNNNNNNNIPSATPLTQHQFEILLSVLEKGDSNTNLNSSRNDETPPDDSNDTMTSARPSLEDWVTEYLGGDVNRDVLIDNFNLSTSSRKRKRPPDNYGSLLLIACEMNFVQGVKALIRRGADVNYRHPASHGNCPLLRCAEMGYTDCLEELLNVEGIDLTISTNEYKLVLGQSIPQYEAGGRSALLLAIEASNTEVVNKFLDHPDGQSKLLNMKDSFGRSPLEAAFEVLSMKDDPSKPVHGLAMEITRILSMASMQDYEEALKLLMMDKSVAIIRWRQRNTELRRRFLVESHTKQQNEKEKGLALVQERYADAGLRRHPEIYTSKFDLDALVSVTKDEEGSNSNNSSDKNTGNNGLDSPLCEPIPGVFHFPLLTRDHCEKICEELLNYEEIASKKPELELPYYVRHDGNFGSLQDCGFSPLLQSIEKELALAVKKLMPNIKGNIQVYHAFLTRNGVDREENATFKIHCDKSDLTFNICVQKSPDVQGSTVGFYDNTSSPDDDGDPTERERRHTLVHQVGYAVLHSGASWHKTDPIVKGTRSSVIVWARIVGEPCNSCGASVGATWLFCKKCGKHFEGQ